MDLSTRKSSRRDKVQFSRHSARTFRRYWCNSNSPHAQIRYIAGLGTTHDELSGAGITRFRQETRARLAMYSEEAVVVKEVKKEML